MGRVSGPTDATLARLAGPLRVLSLDELRDAGLTEKMMRPRLAQGRLRHLWTPVYLVGPGDPSPLSLARAATKSCGGSVSNHWATFVHAFAEAPSLPVDVLVTRGSRDGRPGKVLVHRSRIIRKRDLGTIGEVPVTSGARTLLDVASLVTLTRLEALVAQAQVVKAVTPEQLHEILGRAGRHPGAHRLRAVLTESPGLTLSEAERILRRLLHEAEIDQPITNYAIGRYFADFAWPRHMLIVEFDSYKHHGHKRAFHHDRERNTWLTSQGWSVMTISSDQLSDRPTATAARIARALALRERAGP